MHVVSHSHARIVAEARRPGVRRTQGVPPDANDPRNPSRRPRLQNQQLNRPQFLQSQNIAPEQRVRRDTRQKSPQRPKEKTAQRKETESSDLLLPRSILMDKEVITRTSGKRLGYIDDIFVEPIALEVTTLYLRQNVSSISLGSTTREHVSLSSLRQIGDVVLVHDESSLWDPPGDESMGFVKVVGSEVQTEDGLTLGKVRDFLFNPDSGQMASIRYDALGIPSIPQELLGCSRLDERDIIAVGPSRTIVRRGADKRAVRESEGWVSEYVTSFINLIGGMDIEDFDTGKGGENYRADPAYAAWYKKHARDYEMYYNQKLPEPILMDGNRTKQNIQKRRQQNKTLALPPPQRRSIDQAFAEEFTQAPRRGTGDLRQGTMQSSRQRDTTRTYETSREGPTPKTQQKRMTLDQQTKEKMR